ncbi:MAG: tetratricopeptide repeat protein [Chloroflexi bacterium]|nr:tetratricopeptide repeat protein [Chloroflexota bacterium]
MPTPTAPRTVGDLLKFLRRRARLTQRELALAVGYTEAHVCRLEKNQRPPDLTTIAALFGSALDLEDEPQTMARLLKLAAAARDERPVTHVTVSETTIRQEVIEELGTLEDIPALPPHYVPRPELQRQLHAALQHDRHVMVSGLPGMGKTTLASSVARAVAQAMPVFWLTFRPGLTATFEVIVRQLALFLLATCQSGILPPQLRDLARPASGGTLPPDRQLTLIGAALARQPVLLCFDEVQTISADDSIVALFRLLRGTPAQIMCMGREAAVLPGTPTLRLNGLEPAEARQLISQLDFTLAPALLERLLIKTARSPMLLRLTAGQLHDSTVDARNFVDRLDTQPQVAAYLVDTVLRDLSAGARWLADLIAVFRQPIDLYDEMLIELIAPAGGPTPLDRALAELQRRHLIDQPREAALHPLVRDHLYTALAIDPGHKKQLHLVAAQWAECHSGDLVETAHHYTRAGRLAQVAQVLVDQSEALFNRGQALAAAEVIDEALAQARLRRGFLPAALRQLLTARGDVLKGTRRAAEAEASYREALALAHGQPMARAGIVRVLGQSLMQRGQTAESLRLCQSALADLPPGDVIMRARLLAVQCRAHLALSEYGEAERTARAALVLAPQFAEYLPQVADDVTARTERTLGWINYTRHPQGDECLAHYRRALAAARRSGVRVIEAATLSNIGVALVERGDWDGAVQSYQAAYAAFEALGDVYSMASVLHNLAEVHHKRHELATALQYLEQVCEMERSVGDHEGRLSSEEGRAAVLLDMGQLTEARTILDEVMSGFTESSDVWTLGSCLIMLAEVQVLHGQIAAARSTIERALAMPGIQENARIRTWAQSTQVVLHLGAGEVAAAQQQITAGPPDDVGYELMFRWQMVACLVTLAGGDEAGGRAAARAIADQARAVGHLLNATTADRIAASPIGPVGDLPRLLYPGQ